MVLVTILRRTHHGILRPARVPFMTDIRLLICTRPSLRVRPSNARHNISRIRVALDRNECTIYAPLPGVYFKIATLYSLIRAILPIAVKETS